MAQLRISAPNCTWDSYTSLVTAGQGIVKQATITQTANQIKTTGGFTGSETVADSYTSDIPQTTVTLQGRMDPPTLGSRFGVTWAAGYTANLRSFAPTFTWPVQEMTPADDGTPPDAYEFGYRLMEGTVALRCILDSTPSLPLAGASGPCTFTVSDNDGDTVILSFANLNVTNISLPIETGSYPEVDVQARIDGPVTLSGTESDTLYDSMANGSNLIYNPGPDTLSITEQTNVTHSGEAFVSSLSVTHTIGQTIDYSVTAQVTGPWTFDTNAGA